MSSSVGEAMPGLSVHAYDVTYAQGVGSHIGLPSTTLTFVLPVGEPLEVSWAADRSTRHVSWASLAGLHGRPAEIRHSGAQRGVQVAIEPSLSQTVFGVPAGELADLLTHAADVRTCLAALPEQLAELPPQRWASTVLRAIHDAAGRDRVLTPEPAVQRALVLLRAGRTVDETAQTVGLSRRRLSTVVRRETGVTPRQFRRLARFERAHHELRPAPQRRRSVADVAAACGFSDQAHLARDWQEFAGCSPSEWLAREFPNVQAGVA